MAKSTLLAFTSTLPNSAWAKQLTFRMANRGLHPGKPQDIPPVTALALAHPVMWREGLQENP